MKKKLMILVALVAIAVMAFGIIGSGAWFTTTASVTGGVITTGEMKLTAWGGPLVVNNIEPGAPSRVAGVFCARNDGNYNLKLTGQLVNVNTGTSKGLQDYVKLEATINPPEAVGTYLGGTSFDVFKQWISDGRVKFTTLMAANKYMDIPADYPMKPGETGCWQIRAYLDSSATNAQMNASLTADILLNASQAIAP